MITWALILALIATPAAPGAGHAHRHGHHHRHGHQVCVPQPIIADPPPCLHLAPPPPPLRFPGAP